MSFKSLASVSSMSLAHVAGPPLRDLHRSFDTILVIDFGSNQAQAIVKRLREIHVYSEVIPCNENIFALSWRPKGIILSGGPYNVNQKNAPHLSEFIWSWNVPVLGICYGLQELAWHFSGTVLAADKPDLGKVDVQVQLRDCQLFKDMETVQEVWMSYADRLLQLPVHFRVIAAASCASFAGIQHEKKPWYGLQFELLPSKTTYGTTILTNFATEICKVRPRWNMSRFYSTEMDRLHAQGGRDGLIIGAISGGIDSIVAAKMMQTAFGNRFLAIMIDNGVLGARVVSELRTSLSKLGIKVYVVNKSAVFEHALRGITEQKHQRQIISETFISAFKEAAMTLQADAINSGDGRIEYLSQATLYSNVMERQAYKGPSSVVRGARPVGGLAHQLGLKPIEPLSKLLKNEVRDLALAQWKFTEEICRPLVEEHLQLKVVGQRMLREHHMRIANHADGILMQELRASGHYREISPAYISLFSIPILGDFRKHTQITISRCIQTVDFMVSETYFFLPGFTDHVLARIENEVRWVNKVTYAGKPMDKSCGNLTTSWALDITW